MTTSELIADLRARGVVLEPEGDKLHVTAPVGVLTDEIKSRLAERKAELIALIRRDSVIPLIQAEITGEVTACEHCNGAVFVGQMFCDFCGAYFHW